MDLAAVAALRSDQGRAVLAGLAAYDPSTALVTAERLRRDGHDETLVAAALTQARLRERARPKLGDLADRLLLTPDGLEQATRPEVAARHAARYAALGGDGPVVDLCCGIGGDLLALAAAGLPVRGVDRDPVTAEVARANAEALGLHHLVDVECADALATGLGGARGVFVDPARRGSRGRTFDPRAYSPPFDAVVGIAARVPATGAKLGPGIPHDALPTGTEAEWVSVGGDVVECALWWGPLAAPTARRATLLPAGATVTGDGSARAPVGPVRSYLHEPDGAVIRAGLVAEVAAPHDGTLLDASIAYVATDRPVDSPFLRSYQVTDVLPFSVKRLRDLLRSRGIGRLTVKKRGTAVTPEELRRQMRLSGDGEATVVLTRVSGAQTVLVVQPVPSGQDQQDVRRVARAQERPGGSAEPSPGSQGDHDDREQRGQDR
jgi:SAM-dependent methyltransferase